jgi:hypothetical protein
MNLKDILGKKIKITYRDIGSSFYSTVKVFVSAASEAQSHSTTEVKILLSCKGYDKFPPFILIGIKKGEVVFHHVYLPWVNTDNPNDSFVPCELEII